MQNSPSEAAQILVTIIPIVGIVMGAVVLFLYLIFNHRQRMLMIEKGQFRRLVIDYQALALLTGLLTLGIGLSLTVFFYFKDGFAYSVLSGLHTSVGRNKSCVFF
jgi:hypothetical protein